MRNDLTIVILAAGKGSRMHSQLPKVCHHVGGQPMLAHVLTTASKLNPDEIVTVVAPDLEPVIDVITNFKTKIKLGTAIQAEQKGTGHAVLCAKEAIARAKGNVLILFGDTPLITVDTLLNMIATQENMDAAIVVLGFQPEDTKQYGMIDINDDGFVTRIVEAADAKDTDSYLSICNSGVMLLNTQYALTILERIGTNNAKGEYYLTDAVNIAISDNLKVGLCLGEDDELLGVNSKSELAQAEYILQTLWRGKFLEQGVGMTDPETVYFSYDTQIEPDVFIEPHVFFGPEVKIEKGARINAYSHITAATIGKNADIGPFARLRPGSVIGENAKVGNFVEVKNSTLGSGAKANHHSYIGDASVGAASNIGAGTIFANYDGYLKHKTEIGEQVFIGSNSCLVAPVTIEDRAIVAAGSVITSDVATDAIAIARADQREIAGAAIRYKDKQLAKKKVG